MICPHYTVIVKDRRGKIIYRTLVFSFDEAYYVINRLREEFENAWSFTIEGA